jgi:hypothetical protein
MKNLSIVRVALLAVVTLAAGASRADAGGGWNLMRIWDEPRKPMIEFGLGAATPAHRLLQGKFSDVRQIELGLGYRRSESDSGMATGLDEKQILVDYSSGSLFGRTLPAGDIGSTMLRFGTSSREGYAYDFGGTFLFPYHQTRFLWSKITTDRPAALAASDVEILNRYEGAFRFGASTEGGVALGLADLVSLRVGYEASVVYPRHVFWPWLGSMAIGGIGVGAVSRFGREIVETSPVLGPIVYALLRSALAYGYYVLVRDDQYWPFRSEAPMTSTALKVGLRLTF